MAISKILYMKDCGNAFHGKHLKAALDYISDPDKTQNGRLIAGINCIPEFAYEQMKETKREFGKMDKRQAYHIIISFKEGEVDADTAFEITEKFTKEYLGDKYEAVYSVHDNTNHIHSHIVFNSVSFLDGRKYRYEKGDWARYIQPITNRLCEKYGISTIEIESERPKSSEKEWDVYKDGPYVWSDMIQRDLDVCVMQAQSYEEFLMLLQSKGYEVKQGKYLAVKPKGMSRFRRTKSLGEDYTENAIRQRIPNEQISSYKQESFEETERIVYANIPKGKRAKLSGIQKRYYAKLYRIGLLKRKPYSQAWQYKDEIRKMHQLQKQYLFLIEYDITNFMELQERINILTEEKKVINREKSKVYRSRKKCEDLFRLQEEMKELMEAERAYQVGDTFFQEEHIQWTQLNEQLQETGYSYDEVMKLKEHFREEINRTWLMEKEKAKQIRIGKSILQEIVEDARKQEQIREEQIEEKKQIKDQPSR